uniref:NADH dehydrogenase subunit 6 n=1 Tax=Hesperus amabilis TaxID=1912673 RepID=UPI00279D83BF|nr:NADH dehydrogenase subunit 6 [Hesperus amabilis]WGO76438.1 NADH dehydrogenase subunit 6 [Hesperus amabilis]
MMIMLMITTLSCMFIFLKHPMTMGMNLMLQTILIAIFSGMLNVNFWFSYILFLIMIGGMLVLFIYMTSVASNEKFKFSLMMMIFFFIMLTLTFFIYFMMDNNFFHILDFSEMFNFNTKMNLNMSKFFNYPSNMMLFMMIIYLFITLIAVVNITDIKFGPLRQKY